MYTTNYKVYWRHESYSPNIPVHLKEKELDKINSGRKISQVFRKDIFRNKTTCIIEDTQGVVVSKSEVKQYFKDTPNRKIALKESFKRAVSAVYGKENRRELWEGFKEHNSRCLNC